MSFGNDIYSANGDALAQYSGTGQPVVPAPVYAATLAMDPFVPGGPQGAPSVTVTTTSGVGNATLTCANFSRPGTQWQIMIANDSGGARTITFGSGFRTSGTVVGTASKNFSVDFTSDGVSNWIETGRSSAAV